MKRRPHAYKCRRCDWTGNGNKAHKVKFPNMTFLVCPACGGSLDERQEWKDYMTAEAKRQKSLSCWGDFREAKP